VKRRIRVEITMIDTGDANVVGIWSSVGMGKSLDLMLVISIKSRLMSPSDCQVRDATKSL
jgi:hypothetical protein